MNLLQKLAESMQKVQYQALELQKDDLPSLDSDLPQFGAIVLGIAGSMLFVLGLGKLVLRKKLALRWPALSEFARKGGRSVEALHEFKRLELLATIIRGKTDSEFGEWFALTDSEQVIALGTLVDKSTKELAEELACTPSYIYNVRASIRKKWKLDADVNLRSAIAERYAQTGKALPVEFLRDGKA